MCMRGLVFAQAGSKREVDSLDKDIVYCFFVIEIRYLARLGVQNVGIFPESHVCRLCAALDGGVYFWSRLIVCRRLEYVVNDLRTRAKTFFCVVGSVVFTAATVGTMCVVVDVQQFKIVESAFLM